MARIYNVIFDWRDPRNACTFIRQYFERDGTRSGVTFNDRVWLYFSECVREEYESFEEAMLAAYDKYGDWYRSVYT